ncbi:MAG TPA: HEAT repeat domain-containing protein [Nocardioidaceae bacterium]|nr:HEAT repeat domain-containing protein [Nocardioidaceae bacterium]
MIELVRLLLLLFGGAAAVLVLVLTYTRVHLELRERRLGRRQDALRRLILTALLGEPGEAAAARSDLRGRRGRAWDQVEEQAFAMLPKIRGDAREVLVTVLLSRGALSRAHERTRSWSLVRRARGAYQLGALGQREAVPALLGLLGDRHFLVRRTAVRALGQVGEPQNVAPLFATVAADPSLARDVLAAITRIGPYAADPLRRELARALESGAHDRRGALSATGLGLLGDIGSGSLLVRALEHPEVPGLPTAAAEAIGLIGLPAAVPSLLRLLEAEDAGDVETRVAAAAALGRIADPVAVPGLSVALDGVSRESDRAVAGALLRLGPEGREALAGHSSPYAAEALAVHAVRAVV